MPRAKTFEEVYEKAQEKGFELIKVFKKEGDKKRISYYVINNNIIYFNT